MALMENSTSAAPIEWEYYYDYLDPVIVDETKLKYNKCKSLCFIEYLSSCVNEDKLFSSSLSDSVVIIFWIVLAAFVGLLFLSLNLMSRSGNLPR